MNSGSQFVVVEEQVHLDLDGMCNFVGQITPVDSSEAATNLIQQTFQKHRESVLLEYPFASENTAEAHLRDLHPLPDSDSRFLKYTNSFRLEDVRRYFARTYFFDVWEIASNGSEDVFSTIQMAYEKTSQSEFMLQRSQILAKAHAD